MTDTELFEIVNGHREAWPEDVDVEWWPSGDVDFVRLGSRVQFPDIVFEAAFHRALIARGDVYTHHLNGTYTVQTGDHDFTGGSLIEAYAAALEWLK